MMMLSMISIKNLKRFNIAKVTYYKRYFKKKIFSRNGVGDPSTKIIIQVVLQLITPKLIPAVLVQYSTY